MMPNLPLPDEKTIGLAIAERLRELRTLRSVARALARHRRESQKKTPTYGAESRIDDARELAGANGSR